MSFLVFRVEYWTFFGRKLENCVGMFDLMQDFNGNLRKIKFGEKVEALEDLSEVAKESQELKKLEFLSNFPRKLLWKVLNARNHQSIGKVPTLESHLR